MSPSTRISSQSTSGTADTAQAPADFPSQGRARIETLDCLRGVAALAVMWFHLTQGNATFLPEGLVKRSGAHGWLGVEIFFVISGFVLPFALRRANYGISSYGTFAVKRMLRLEPPYLACIALILVLNFASTVVPGFQGPRVHFDLSSLLLHLGYLVGLTGGTWLNPAFWTLGIEFQFYLLIGLLFPLLIARSTLIRTLTVYALAFSALLIPQTAWVPHRLGLFALGIWAFQVRSGLVASPGMQALGWVLLTTASGLAVGWLIAAVSLLSALAIVFAQLRWRPLLFLGNISYSLYLLHIPIGGRVINLGSRFAETDAAKCLVLALAVALTIAVATLFHRWIELPALRWAGRIRY